MESDKLIGKLGRLALLLQEYDFEVVHRVGITNLDVDGFSRNPNPSNKDLTGAKWHRHCDQEVVSGWHAAAYLTLLYGAVVDVPIHGLDDETYRPQGIADICEDIPILHKLQQRTFFSSTSAMKNDRIRHRITKFCWENDLLFRLWSDGTRYIVPRLNQRAPLER